ncbi:MAG: PAS domain-containing protein [Thiogranum sp.]|nr:PAS domain-containing protein [Thiogranum sp.]
MSGNGGKTHDQLCVELARAQARIAELEAAHVPATDHSRFLYVDASPVPCALNDDAQNIVHLNPAFIRTFGYTLNDIPTLSDWWPRAYPDPAYSQWVARSWQQRLDQARQQGLPFEPLEVNIRCNDGSRRIVMIGASALDAQINDLHLVTLYDITAHKQMESELKQTATLLENVINSTPDLIFVKNDRLQTILCNEAYARAVGKDRESMYGKTDLENGWEPGLVYGNPDQGIRGFIHDDRDALSGLHVHNFCDPANINGSTRIFDTHKLPLRNEQARIVGMLGIARDITEREEAALELQKHRRDLEAMVVERTAELENANRELESFAYSVSHDLRAPLRALDGFSQILLEEYADKFDAEGEDCLHRIRHAAQRMGRLIDDLLALSRMASCEIRREDIDLSQIAETAVRKLREYEPQRDIEVVIEAGISGWGDACLIDVVLDNLIGNAWKYTGRTRHPRIEFSVSEVNDTKVYRIRDNGVGFNMQHAGKLFGAFQRLHKAHEFEGTGIGLATVARIIQRHGGKVWAEAEEDLGASFYFTLPGGQA